MTTELSIILLDWSVRERFQSVYWLQKQTVPRHLYELIWVECHDRVVPEVAAGVNFYITLNQAGLYNKHKGNNAGLACASGRVVTFCDSDAVFPPNFVENVLNHFQHMNHPLLGSFIQQKVLNHYELRCPDTYPSGVHLPLKELLKDREWKKWENNAACVSCLRRDAIGFGGMEEHDITSGYVNGPNDLVWRLINSGVPHMWEPDVVLWHFHHDGSGDLSGALKREGDHEGLQTHLHGHNSMSVEAFRAGRLLPLVENEEIHKLRMSQRIIGSDFDRKYS